MNSAYAPDRDRAAMLLGDDVVADQKTQTGVLAGWSPVGCLGLNERPEAAQMSRQPGCGAGLDATARVEQEGRYFAAVGSRGSTICVCVMSAASFPSER